MSSTVPPYDVIRRDGRTLARLNGDKPGLILGPTRPCDGTCGKIGCRLEQCHVLLDDGVEMWLCRSHFSRVVS